MMNSDINNIVFFDGYCNLCNKTVDILIKVDKKKKLYYAPLQGQTAKKMIPDLVLDDLETVLFYRSEKLYRYSRAIIEICNVLGGIYRFLYLTIIIPTFIRDFLYRFIAKKRYLIFGKRTECRLPDPDMKNFLK